jgi:hypothetical protein
MDDGFDHLREIVADQPGIACEYDWDTYSVFGIAVRGADEDYGHIATKTPANPSLGITKLELARMLRGLADSMDPPV